MEIKINYYEEIEANIVDQIYFILEEFDYLFGQKAHFTSNDRDLAAGLINYLARIVDTPSAIQHLSKTLEKLETKYPNLF